MNAGEFPHARSRHPLPPLARAHPFELGEVLDGHGFERVPAVAEVTRLE